MSRGAVAPKGVDVKAKTDVKRTDGDDRSRERRRYEAPRVLHCEKIESLAVVCNSARAPSGSCRVASVATCITLYS